MSRDADKAGSAARNSCPLCGSDEFTWGVARGHYPLTFMFKLDKPGWWATHIAMGNQEIKARRCDSCGNIQLFALEGVASEQQPSGDSP